MPELRTLTTLWLDSFPFGIMTSPSPALSRITLRYTLPFNNKKIKETGNKNVPVFTLLFGDFDVLMSPPTPSFGGIRAALLPDEKRNKIAEGTAFRKNTAVITTWEWNHNAGKASFWLDETVARKWKEDEWWVTVLRQDIWDICAEPERVEQTMRVCGE